MTRSMHVHPGEATCVLGAHTSRGGARGAGPGSGGAGAGAARSAGRAGGARRQQVGRVDGAALSAAREQAARDVVHALLLLLAPRGR